MIKSFKPKKNEFCPFLLKGSCKKGELCDFSHDISKKEVKMDDKKNKPCPFLKNGGCKKGNDCNFSHELEKFEEKKIDEKLNKIPCTYFF